VTKIITSSNSAGAYLNKIEENFEVGGNLDKNGLIHISV